MKVRDQIRHILHADLDAFYTSVEQLDNPSLLGKPVIVGGSPQKRGVVAAASYEARRFGIHSAMPTKTALRYCPHVILINPRFDRYRSISSKVMDIFRDVTSIIEPLSLDEAYLDITHIVEWDGNPADYAKLLKTRVKQELGLILSVGVSTSKSISKIASDIDKPDGLVIVEPGQESKFLADLHVGKLMGIGPKTVEYLESSKIFTIGQLSEQPLEWFIEGFGKRGIRLFNNARGDDSEPVRSEKTSKSVSVEGTFSEDLYDPDEIYLELSKFAERLAHRLKIKSLKGKTITLKLRLNDFTILNRQSTLNLATYSEQTILETAWKLALPEITPGRTFRLIGIGISQFPLAEQLQLPWY